MNKKFIVVSLGILLSAFILLGLSNLIFKDKVIYSEGSDSYLDNMKVEITYDDYKETNDGYEIKVNVKNNSKYIASIRDIKLSPQEISNSMEFRGIEEYVENGDYIMGINTEGSKGYIFTIPKGIYFDKNLIDINNMRLYYSVDFYRYRIGENTLFMSVGSMSDSILLKNNLNTEVLYINN